MIEIYDSFYVLKEKGEEFIIPKKNIKWINCCRKFRNKPDYEFVVALENDFKLIYDISKEKAEELKKDYKEFLETKHKLDTTVYMDSGCIR